LDPLFFVGFRWLSGLTCHFWAVFEELFYKRKKIDDLWPKNIRGQPAMAHESMAGMIKSAPMVLVSIVIGFFLIAHLARVSNAMEWGLFTGWGLAHGSFIIAWPLLTLASYGAIRAIRHR
jgi:hypothetical protein